MRVNLKTRYFTDQIQKSVDEAMALFKVKERVSVSQCAETHRWIPPESSTSGKREKWRNSTVPYLVMPMDCYNDPGVRRIILKTAAQVGKTELILNIILYIIMFLPGSSMFVYPDLKAAIDDFVTVRLRPMIRVTRPLREMFERTKLKNVQLKNTQELMQYLGGYLRFIGSNDPNALRGRPQRDCFIDELSAIENSSEQGSKLKLAENRQKNFYNAKSILTSTPLVLGTCEITKLYDESKRHEYLVKCISCREDFHFGMDGLKCDDIKKPLKSTYYVCPHCGYKIQNEDKPWMLRHGRWLDLDSDLESRDMGFHLSAFESPWVPFGEIMDEYLKALKDPDDMQSFQNNYLGLAYLKSQIVVNQSELASRAIAYKADLPAEVLYLAMGVDINQTDLTIQVVGFGEGFKPFVIRYKQLPGDPNLPAVWKDLEEEIRRPYAHEYGFNVSISDVALDINYATDIAEEFCFNWFGRNVHAFRGQPGVKTPEIDLSPRFFRKRVKNGTNLRKVPVYFIGDHKIKKTVYSMLTVQDKESSHHVSFPTDDGDRNTGESYYTELTRETLKIVRGAEKWHRPKGKRNEALDTFKLAMAMAKIKNPDFVSRKIDFEKRREQVELFNSLNEDEKKHHEEHRSELISKIMAKVKEGLKE